MARQCAICSHADAEAIDKALVGGLPNRRIATQYGMSEGAVRRHAKDHLPGIIEQSTQAIPANGKRRTQPTHDLPFVAEVAYQERKPAQHGINVMAELERCFGRVNKLFDACDVWLTDPRDASRYDIGPRAGDVDVVYEITDNALGVVIERKHARLSWLQAALEKQAKEQGTRLRILQGETKYADPRKLVLEAAAQLRGQLELLVDLMERAHNAERMAAFEAAVLEVIGQADAPTQERIAHALQSNRGIFEPGGQAPASSRAAGEPGAAGA
ncbi:MAG: hypothetical protein JWO59_723 [Chloroflexi bacterium]|nr:hypothetical protein [Chloroflexota bacterium]